jgi:hypothetical protein
MKANDLLRPDNHDLYDHVRLMILSKDPIFTIDQIAGEFAVTPEDLMRWIMAYKEPRGKRQPYQSPRFSAIGQPRVSTGPDWAREENARKFLAWKRQRDGARATREAAEAAKA